jgi:iron(III) transport system substrate-binding protein
MNIKTGQNLGAVAVVIGIAAAMGLPSQSMAQGKPDTQSILKKLEGIPQAAREKILIEGAKKEGKVVWYTTDAPKPTQIMFKAFRKKYPFIETQLIRAKSRAILDRILTETRAGKYFFDLAKTSTETFNYYPVKKVFASYNSPAKSNIPAKMKGERWASIFTFIRAIGYNSDQVKREDLPKTWNDLLDPKWKGKIMFDPSSLPEVAILHRRWGQEKAAAYFDKLGKSGNLQIRRGRTVIAKLLSAGEAPLGVTVYPYRIERMKKKGAPVDWALLDPSPGLLQPVSIGRNAPHPYSAALLYDFIFSKAGQKVYAKMNRVPADPTVKGRIPRMVSAVKDSRLVLNSTNSTSGDMRKAVMKILDEKIIKPAFNRKKK